MQFLIYIYLLIIINRWIYFGDKWTNYEEKIKKDWQENVTDDDTVIIAGDFSWAMYLEETVEDFKYINELPGKKILLKGNHDYWWETLTKMNNFLNVNKFKNIYFLHNNFYEVENFLICGTRYWCLEENEDNERIFCREIQRAKISLSNATKSSNKPIIMVTHYPPDNHIMNTAKEYNIEKWIYGHIHSNYEESLVFSSEIDMYLTSCDYLNFELKRISN